jgi:hypothetical protein
VYGILLQKEKRHRLVIGVHLIHQAPTVEIDVNDVIRPQPNGSPFMLEGRVLPELL